MCNSDPRLALAACMAVTAMVTALPAPSIAQLLGFTTLVVAPLYAHRGVLRRLAVINGPIIALSAIGGLCASNMFQAISVGWRIALCVAAVETVLNTHTTANVMAAMRWYRVPTAITSILIVASRYRELMIIEAQSQIRAIEMRGYRQTTTMRVRAYGHLAANLCCRSVLRSERMSFALVARGYDGNLPVGPLPGFAPKQVIACLIQILVAIALTAGIR